MKNIATIFKKELLDTLRDRRTLITMIIAPLLIIPIIMSLMSSIQKSQTDSAREKELRIVIESNNNGAELVKQFERRADMKILDDVDPTKYNELIRTDSLDFALVLDKGFDKALLDGKTANINIFYNSTSDRVLYERLEKNIENYKQNILQDRLDSLQTTLAMINPIDTKRTDVYTRKESIGKLAGGFLPYVFVLFCLFGGMYPAIDLFTGEKERGTIETILTVPASRLEILLGKMLVIIIAGVISGLLTIVGLYLALRINPNIPQEMLNIASQILTPSVIGLVVLMLIPLTTFFAGILIPVSIYAKSFKEAQSLIQPISIVVIVPLAIGMIPSIKLNVITALIPVLNVALASREIIAGTIDYSLLAIVFASLFVLAAIGILLCVRWFAQEGNILRT